MFFRFFESVKNLPYFSIIKKKKQDNDMITGPNTLIKCTKAKQRSFCFAASSMCSAAFYGNHSVCEDSDGIFNNIILKHCSPKLKFQPFLSATYEPLTLKSVRKTVDIVQI